MVQINQEVGRAGAAFGFGADLQISLLHSVGDRQREAGQFAVDVCQLTRQDEDRFT